MLTGPLAMAKETTARHEVINAEAIVESEKVAVRTGQHADYGRLVFDWSKPVGYDVTRDGNKITVIFDRPGEIDLSSAVDGVGLPLLDVRVHADGRRIVLEVENGAEFKVRAFDDNVLAIDLTGADHMSAGQTAAVSPGTGVRQPKRSEMLDIVLSDETDDPEITEALGRQPADDLVDAPFGIRMAQFALPKKAPGDKPGSAPVQAPAKNLKLEYVFGTEAELEFLRNLDLQDNLSDNSAILAPTVFGSVTYRPTDSLETWLEVTAEKLISIREESTVILPDGSSAPADSKPLSLLVDQAYVKYEPLGGDFAVTVGRRNFEDQRLWLYDTAMDGIIVALKPGDFNIEASLTRENALDLDLTAESPESRNNFIIVYGDYRGIEDHRLAGYWILQDDVDENPQLTGVRAIGRPTDPFNYWTELAFATGRSNEQEEIRGYGAEAGGTYRFLDLPWQPSVTLGYAVGSGDGDPGDGVDYAFRQTGIGSNEGRFGGVTQFVTYGEALAPELSNIHILTAGVGFRPLPGMFVDLVYHRYRFDQISDEVKGSNLTAIANQVAGQQSKDIGDEFDIILGFRDLFGLRGLGLETRAGLFFPGDAFKRQDGSSVVDGELAASILVVAFF